jgi:serine/threonine protein kinase
MPGGTIANYHCLKTLGRGSFGKVKESVSKEDGRTYAVKLISPEIAEEDRESITREVEALERL